jgi:glycosyltransferase involved in cell wall biosynthesis
MALNSPRTLLVIPVFNNGKTLRSVAERSLETGFDVLVVDDGSTDGGPDTISDLPVARCRLPVNRGKGAAILAGAALAKRSGHEAILTVDADGQHDPAEARRLWEAAAASWPVVVVGARRMEGADVPSSSVFGRSFSNFWVRLECGQSLPDSQSGYRLYPVDFLASGSFLSARYPFEVEVLVRAAWAGLQIVSVPVSVHYPPSAERVSHFRPFVDNLRLTALHTWLVTRSLLPWPHRKLARKEGPDPEAPGILQPVKFFRRLSTEHSGAGELAASSSGLSPSSPSGSRPSSTSTTGST